MIRMKNIKKSFCILCLVCLLAGIMAPGAAAAEQPEIVSSSAIVTELTSGTTLMSLEPDLEVDPGSVTKVVLLYVLSSQCFKGNADLRDKVTLTDEMMREESSVIPLVEGEVLKYEDLLYLMYMDYSPTAAYAAAIYALGSAQAVVDEMNAFAASCGCQHTEFTDLTGMGEQHTTASDLILMLEAAIENTVFREIFSAVTYTVAETNRSISRTLTTSNQLQRTGSSYYCRECTGGRFGGGWYGYTTISLSMDEDSGMELIVIAANAESKAESYTDAQKLIRWTFDSFSWRTVLLAGENITTVPVDLARDTDHVVAVPAGDIRLMLDNSINIEDFTREVVLYEDTLTAPVEKGQAVGKLHLLYKGAEYADIELVTAKPVDLMRMEYMKRIVSQTAKSAGVITLLTVLVVMLGAYLLYAISYRGYRLGKKTKYASIRKKLKAQRKSGEYMQSNRVGEDTISVPQLPRDDTPDNIIPISEIKENSDHE